MKKKLNTTPIRSELSQSGYFRQRPLKKPSDKDLNKDLDKDVKQDGKKDVVARSNNLPPAEVVEEMVFRFRKETKIRINADFPEAWKQELDEYAHQAGVGKYHLVMYAVGQMLGKI